MFEKSSEVLCLMDELSLPNSPDSLVRTLKRLHARRKTQTRHHRRRRSLTRKNRDSVLKKTDGRCHLCGGKIKEEKFAADHVLAHAVGGEHALENYLAAHALCNGCRWFYSPEEFQWILRFGVWARKQMEDKTSIGNKMLQPFLIHEKAVRKRRKAALLEREELE
jgi:hypothetical protein